MNCPVCKRELAPTLSICLTCGAMMNDSVREELQTKIVTNENAGRPASRKLPPTLPQFMPAQPVARKTAVPFAPPERPRTQTEPAPAAHTEQRPKAAAETATAAAKKFETSELGNKKTSPTLVGFQNKNATVPDWRLQLQNAIRQRKGGSPAAAAQPDNSQPVAYQAQLVTRGANALKADIAEETAPAELTNPKVANALRRIEQSRKVFSTEKAEAAAPAQTAPARNYPFNVVEGNSAAAPAPTSARANVNPAPRPRLVSALKIEKKGFDTNKLPPLPTAPKVNSGKLEAVAAEQLEELNSRLLRDETPADMDLDVREPVAAEEPEIEEIDDLAPIAMRFNAGLFDLIIGGFASLILLSPFILSGGMWLSVSGVLAFAAAMAIVMFVYLTVSVAFYGRSFGMRLFSLELVDAEENEYPTLHQAAVNSAVFLLSFALAGVGFLPMLFNDERRAAHDLISNTILIREY